MRKISKKKPNPYFQKDLVKQILGNIDFTELSDVGAESETYYFKLNKTTKLKNFTNDLSPGEYVLKIYPNNPTSQLNNNEILYLKNLSNLHLIPKIFIITNNFIIMKFINGNTLNYLLNNRMLSKNQFALIYDKIIKLKNYYHKLGYAHADLNKSNIIIDKNYNVYFIDPNPNDGDEFYFDKDNIKVNALAVNIDYLYNYELYKDWKN